MQVALQEPWTVEQFFAWAPGQEGRYEFDGTRPVAMTGGTANHSRITTNIHAALRARLRGGPCRHFGPALGVRTSGAAIRYPDALITRTRFAGTALLAPDPVIVFEVVSPDSARRDRIDKVREYGAVAAVRRYVIVESAIAGLLVLHRQQAGEPFTALALAGDDVLALPEVGIELPVAELYEDVEFGARPTI